MIKCYECDNVAASGDNYICVCDVLCCRCCCCRTTQTGTRVRCYDIYGKEFWTKKQIQQRKRRLLLLLLLVGDEGDDDDDCRCHGSTER